MNTFDFSPLFRSTVGFDRMSRLLEAANRLDESALSYPPYNIEKADEDAYRISLAVAGFALEDLEIELREGDLVVAGRKPKDEAEVSFLYQGIAARDFRRSFQVADHVKVVGANLEHGVLHIDLVRELPEEMKPRRIKIKSGAPEGLAEKAKKLIAGPAKKVA